MARDLSWFVCRKCYIVVAELAGGLMKKPRKTPTAQCHIVGNKLKLSNTVIA